MNHWQKMSIPIAIGVIAGGLNYVSLMAKTAPKDFVAVARDINKDETLQSGDFKLVPITVDNADLSKAAIPWAAAKMLVGSRASRSLKRNQVLLHSDLRPVALAPPDGLKEFTVKLTTEEAPEAKRLKIGDQVTFEETLAETGSQDRAEFGRFRVLDFTISDSYVELTIGHRMKPGTNQRASTAKEFFDAYYGNRRDSNGNRTDRVKFYLQVHHEYTPEKEADYDQ